MKSLRRSLSTTTVVFVRLALSSFHGAYPIFQGIKSAFSWFAGNTVEKLFRSSESVCAIIEVEFASDKLAARIPLTGRSRDARTDVHTHTHLLTYSRSHVYLSRTLLTNNSSKLVFVFIRMHTFKYQEKSRNIFVPYESVTSEICYSIMHLLYYEVVHLKKLKSCFLSTKKLLVN